MIEETVPLSAFYPMIMGAAPSIATQHVDDQILSHVIRAAYSTGQIRTRIKVDAQAMIGNYPLAVQDGYQLVEVIGVCVNGYRYTPSRDIPCRQPPHQETEICNTPNQFCAAETHSEMVLTIPMYMGDNCCFNQNPCGGTFYVDDVEGEIILEPPPPEDSDDAIEIELAVAPSRLSCVVPRLFFEQWRDDISYGALAILKMYVSADKSIPEAREWRMMWYEALRRMKSARERRKVGGESTMPNTVGASLV